jgi:uncharacterized protein (DUF2336 family)
VNLILAREVASDEAARPAPTIVRRLLRAAQAADAGERADAASALARAYRYGELSHELRREAAVGMTALLEDPSTLARRALAEALASAADAPRHIILALAHDQPEIAAIIAARSPALTEADLIDCAASGGDAVQIALAARPNLTVGIAAALAEIASREAVAALLDNGEAMLSETALRRIAERFGEDGEIREKLLDRPRLPASLRCDLVAAAANALSPLAAAFGLGEQRVEKIMREAREEGAAAVASAVEGRDLAGLVRHLRETGGLTVALLMRAIVTGDRAFFETVAAELSGLPPTRVAALTRAPAGTGFMALYRRTGLPMGCVGPFRAALAALAGSRSDQPNRVLRPVVQRAIAACENIREPDVERLLALLRRLETEAALEEARAFAAEVAADEEENESELESLNNAPPAPSYVLQRAPPLIAVNAFGDVEFLPPPIEALPLAAREAA